VFRFRAGPLRTATFFALGFIGLRVSYRIIFGGASGGGIVLLDVPQIALDGPFAHIVLLGPVTTGGVFAAASSAVPFAVLIVLFGVLNSVVNVGAIFARSATRGPVRSLSRALVVAWATFPALIEATQRIRTATRLRGRRSGATILVPIFEQTIERAITLAATLEARGFAADDKPSGDCTRPASIVDAALNFGGSWKLTELTGELMPGTLTVITGATGSGKSSLLHSLSGLFQHVEGGEQRGRIFVAGIDRSSTPPRNTARLVGVVIQNARLSFAGETVAEELGFALALQGEPTGVVAERVATTAHELGIAHLLERSVTELSAGEASLVSIGAAIVARPILLLVDEPLADLDSSARRVVCLALEQLAHSAGVCVVVAEHNTTPWGATVDYWWRIDRGRLTIDNVAPAIETHQVHEGPSQSGSWREHRAPLLTASAVSVTYGRKEHQLTAVSSANLELRAGEIVALTGPNGAGKSSLLHALALPTARESVHVNGHDVSRLSARDRVGKVALVPERIDDLFVTSSVAHECRLADSSGHTERTFVGLLGYASVEAAGDVVARHPRDLSAGERVCLAIAIQLAAHPSVLLIDEPTRGLDKAARQLVGAAIRTVAAATTPAAVLFATHDHDFAKDWSHATLSMDAGHLTPTQTTPSAARS